MVWPKKDDVLWGWGGSDYLLHDAVKLSQDVKEGNLGDDQLFLLILVEGGSGEVQCKV